MASEATKIYDEKMTKTLAALDSDYATIRAGRANPHVLDKIMVDYYGAPTPINQVGNISVPEPRMIQIQPWDSTMLKAIEKAINASELGIHPGNDGKVIRLIQENPDISREELASRFFLNPDYFAKLFKKETGKALSDYIADLKLEEAKYMLSQTADGISNIASLLGYSNFSYFSKMFRKKTGMTPSEYRKAYYGTIPS